MPLLQLSTRSHVFDASLPATPTPAKNRQAAYQKHRLWNQERIANRFTKLAQNRCRAGKGPCQPIYLFKSKNGGLPDVGKLSRKDNDVLPGKEFKRSLELKAQGLELRTD